MEQLLWRLQNGELPATKHPKVVTVMIGTNGATPLYSPPGLLSPHVHINIDQTVLFPACPVNLSCLCCCLVRLARASLRSLGVNSFSSTSLFQVF